MQRLRPSSTLRGRLPHPLGRLRIAAVLFLCLVLGGFVYDQTHSWLEVWVPLRQQRVNYAHARPHVVVFGRPRVLVVFVGHIEGEAPAWWSFKKHVKDALGADVALLIVPHVYDEIHRMADYVWHMIPPLEPDECSSKMSTRCESGQTMTWMCRDWSVVFLVEGYSTLVKKVEELNYDVVVWSRTDLVYTQDHPQIHSLMVTDHDAVWEFSTGVAEGRHWLARTSTFLKAVAATRQFVCESDLEEKEAEEGEKTDEVDSFTSMQHAAWTAAGIHHREMNFTSVASNGTEEVVVAERV